MCAVDERVDAALGEREAKEILARDQEFDVIVCDMMMPEMPGIEVLRRLREEGPLESAAFERTGDETGPWWSWQNGS